LLFRDKCGIMRCVIKDKATPKKGGVTNRAHQTAASRFEPEISKSRFPPDLCAYNYTKRTQFTPAAHLTAPQIPKTNPIRVPPPANPADRRSVPIYRETQSPQHPRTAGILPAFSQPNYAKRTQFAIPGAYCLLPAFYETNPISTAADLWRIKNAKRTQFPARRTKY